jgi:WD40 repeat protein
VVEQQAPVREAVPARPGSDVFISYSRRDRAVVERLAQALEARGRTAWVDWADIPPTAEWMAEIRDAIEASDTVVVVLSPDSVASPVCGEELEVAISANKRSVPVVVRDVASEDVPAELAKRNWLFLRDQDDFEAGVDRLVATLDTDLDATRFHTGLLVKARQWEQAGEPKTRLLRGSDLTEAERYVASPGKGPAPTQEQISFVLDSRRAATRRQRGAIAITTVVALVAATLGMFAWNQRGAAIANEQEAIEQRERAQDQRAIAEEQARIANSRGLALGSESLADQADLSALLAVEALRVAQTPQAVQAAQRAVQRTLGIERVLRGPPASNQGNEYEVQFSPDGAALVSNARKGALEIWDLSDPSGVASESGSGQGEHGGLDFSPDGSMVATTPGHGVVVSDVASGEVRWSLERKVFPLDVAYLAGGNMVIALQGGLIETWDPSLDDVVARYRVDDATPSANHVVLESSPDGRRYAVASSAKLHLDTLLEIRDRRGRRFGQPLIELHDHVVGVTSVAFDPSGRRLAATTQQGHTLLFDLTGGRAPVEIPIPQASGNEGRDVAFSPDGRLLAVATEQGSVLLWDAVTLKPIGLPIVSPSGVGAIDFAPQGRTLAVSQPDGVVTFWNLDQHMMHGGWVAAISFSPNGRQLASAWVSGEMKVSVWDLPSSRSLGSPLEAGFTRLWDVDSGNFANLGWAGYDVDFASDGHSLLAGGTGRLALWGPEHMVPRSVDTGKAVEVLATQPTGSLVAMGNLDGLIRIVDLADHSDPLVLDGHERGVLDVEFSPDGSVLASSAKDMTFILWDVRSGMMIGKPSPTLDWVRAMDFSPDGRLLALGSWDGAIQVWDLEENRSVGEPLRIHAGPVFGLDFSPDGTRLASGGVDGTVVLWDVATWQPIGDPLMGHSGWVNDVSFSPNGRTLASAGDDGSVILWDSLGWSSNIDEIVTRLCEVAGRNLSRAEWSTYVSSEPYRLTCPESPKSP